MCPIPAMGPFLPNVKLKNYQRLPKILALNIASAMKIDKNDPVLI
jgi:hypothetical protein